VVAGHAYRLTFWECGHGPDPDAAVNTEATGSLDFFGADGQPISPGRIKGYWLGESMRNRDQAEPYLFEGTAPEGAATMAVHFTLHPKTADYADIDDFSLLEVPAELATHPLLPDRVPVEPLLADLKAYPLHGKPSRGTHGIGTTPISANLPGCSILRAPTATCL